MLKVGICWKFKLITNFLVPWIKPRNYSHHGNAQGVYTFKIVIMQFNPWHQHDFGIYLRRCNAAQIPSQHFPSLFYLPLSSPWSHISKVGECRQGIISWLEWKLSFLNCYSTWWCFLPRFQVHITENLPVNIRKRNYMGLTVCASTLLCKKQIWESQWHLTDGEKITITAWPKPCCRVSTCLFFSPLSSHSACCMQNQHSSSITQEKHIPFGVGRGQRIQAAAGGEPDSSGVLNGHFTVSHCPLPPSKEWG